MELIGLSLIGTMALVVAHGLDTLRRRGPQHEEPTSYAVAGVVAECVSLAPHPIR